MSQYAADPDLVERRLATLVRLLEAHAVALETAGHGLKPMGLTAKESREWAYQCRNLMRGPEAPARKPSKAKPIEQMSDEELLS